VRFGRTLASPSGGPPGAHDRQPLRLYRDRCAIVYLYVTLTRDAPPSTPASVPNRPLVATCAVSGEDVTQFAGRCDGRFHQYGTVLLTDDPTVVMAR
jgi:hypothetical protein